MILRRRQQCECGTTGLMRKRTQKRGGWHADSFSCSSGLGQINAETGRTGFLAKDFQEFQSHLLALAKNKGLCDEMGRAAAEFVARSFSMEVRAAQIEKLFLGSEIDSNVRDRIPSPRRGVLPAQEMLTKNLHSTSRLLLIRLFQQTAIAGSQPSEGGSPRSDAPRISSYSVGLCPVPSPSSVWNAAIGVFRRL